VEIAEQAREGREGGGDVGGFFVLGVGAIDDLDVEGA
jgi:hypothetical protein